MLNIFQPKMQLAVCNNCQKLYNVRNIVEYKEKEKLLLQIAYMKNFQIIQPVPSHHNKCNNPLSILKKRKGEIIAVPRIKMCPQYPNCGLIAICDIAEHCRF
ncbi:hypothetical protein RhiirC2_800007 [Rhizophagus irregularis]|uniref:Uncharacterized protein n=1 Tax=Rhizophagus irregularis TaxID=588596 RepID=A0A2N1M480_9GLOM|nr:hypothetical protein RhiirC2_800007 [Rhizophagus irregularis]